MSEQINPNISTSEGQETVVHKAGDGPVSFDELERMHASTERKPAAKAKEKEPSEEKRKESKGKGEPSDAKEEWQKESKEDDDVLTKDVKDGKPLENKAEAVKTIKVKSGEDEVELRSDSMVPVKVGGKTEMVPLQEALNGYSGQAHLSREFATFKKERETFEAERVDLDTAVSTAHDFLVNRKDLRGFIEYVSDAMGVDGDKLYADTVADFRKVQEEWSSLSPEERRQKELEQENQYWKQRHDQSRQAEAKKREGQALESKVLGVMQKYGITEKAQFVARYDELVKTGAYQAEQITPELVGEYHKGIQTAEKIGTLIAEVAPGLDGKDEATTKLVRLALQNDATDEEIREVVTQMYGNQAERKLSKKIAKMETKARAEHGGKRDPQKSPMFFDDLAS